jgi:hypothetical protein
MFDHIAPALRFRERPTRFVTSMPSRVLPRVATTAAAGDSCLPQARPVNLVGTMTFRKERAPRENHARCHAGPLMASVVTFSGDELVYMATVLAPFLL